LASLKPFLWLRPVFPVVQWGLGSAFPPRCPSCDDLVDQQHNFCVPCFQQLQHISEPLCHACGIPFAVPMGEGALCPTCIAEPASYDHIRAPLVYNEASGPVIRALKFHDRYTGLHRSVHMMRAALGPLADTVDMVVPVPLHWRRLAQRRYNQSALLAFGLARSMNAPCQPKVLKRVQATQPQARLSRAERLTNVKHAFAAVQHYYAALQNKTVLLVDDVVTTGATVNACARVLKDAGAARVLVVALARTTKD